jgi:hypothetical protein
MIKPEVYARNKYLAIGKKTIVIPHVRNMRKLLSTTPAQEEVVRYLFHTNKDIAEQVAHYEPESMTLLIQRFTVLGLSYKARFVIPSCSVDVERELFFEDDLGSCTPHLIDAIINSNNLESEIKFSFTKDKQCLYLVKIER